MEDGGIPMEPERTEVRMTTPLPCDCACCAQKRSDFRRRLTGFSCICRSAPPEQGGDRELSQQRLESLLTAHETIARMQRALGQLKDSEESLRAENEKLRKKLTENGIA